jgi:hypothetical protein
MPLWSSGPPVWSSGQSPWLHNGDVLCFLAAVRAQTQATESLLYASLS